MLGGVSQSVLMTASVLDPWIDSVLDDILEDGGTVVLLEVEIVVCVSVERLRLMTEAGRIFTQPCLA